MTIAITAAVVREPGGRFSIEQLTLEAPRAGEVLVRIVATGLCRSDIEAAHGVIPPAAPVVLGHEGAGVVEQVGAGVTHVVPGDHVVLTFPFCGECRSCLRGAAHHCERLFALAISGGRLDGTSPVAAGGARMNACFFGQSSFATHALAYANNTVKVSKAAPLAILGQLGCGVQTGAGTVLNALKPPAGSAIVIFGAGAVGLSAVMAAKIKGCDPIIVVDKTPSRLALGSEFGATLVLDPAEVDVEARLGELGGVDYSIEATGVSAVAELAVRALRPFGVCALVGVGAPGAKLTFDHAHLTLGRSVIGVLEGNSQPQSFIPELVALFLKGDLPIDRLVREYDLADINQAVADVGVGEVIKPVLRPTPEAVSSHGHGAR